MNAPIGAPRPPAPAGGQAPARAAKRSALTTNDLYLKLKEIAVLYRIRPGEHVNEIELARSFGVSRTPLREALNRLVAERLLTFQPNRGFCVRKLERREIFDLYELRRHLEVAAVRLAIERASDAEIAGLRAFWDEVVERAADTGTDALLELDEAFHVRLVGLSGNAEMVHALNLVNARIHFVRWVDMENRRSETYDEHRAIVDALAQRDEARCVRELDAHIARRMDEITRAVNAGVVHLYAR